MALVLSAATLRADNVAAIAATSQYWGSETNGVKAGLSFQLAPGSTNQVGVLFIPVLLSTQATNFNVAPGSLLISFPPFQSRYKMELVDQAGSPVQKTTKGDAMGSPYVYTPPTGVHVGSSPVNGALLPPNQPQFLWEFSHKGHLSEARWLSLQDYFKIRRSGKYHLRFQFVVSFSGANREETRLQQLVPLPPVEATLDLQLRPKPLAVLFTVVKACAKAYGLHILGLTLCAAGAAWLITRRLRRQPHASSPPTPT